MPRIGTTLSTTAPDPATTSPIPVTVTFDEEIDVNTLALEDFQVTNGTATNLQTETADTEFSIEIIPSSNDTTVTVSLSADRVTSASNPTLKNGSANLSVDYLSADLTVSISADESYTNDSPFNVYVTFSEPVTGFISGDLNVTGGSAGAVTTSDDKVFTVPVTPSGEGNIDIDLPAGRAQDQGTGSKDNLASNTLSVEYDSIPPAATLSSGASDPTSSSPIPVTVSFDEPIISFGLSDFSVTNGSVSNLTVVTPGEEYTVSLTPSANGTVSLYVKAGIEDRAGNTSVASGSLSREYDNTRPTVTISTSESDPTNADPIEITVTFSENVNGFNAADITVTNGSETLTGGSDGDAVYTFDIEPDSDGTVTIEIDENVASDDAGNQNQAAVDFTIESDQTPPAPVITTTAGSSTNTSPIPVTIDFGEPVSGFTAATYSTYVTVGNGTASSFTEISDSTYTFEVTPDSDVCTVTVDLDAAAGTDAAGNTSQAATQLSVDYDSERPTVTLSTLEPSPTNNSPFNVTVEFSESVTGFIDSDVTVTNGTATLSGSGDTYTATITPSGQGDVTVKVNENRANDAYGNSNQASNTISVEYDSVEPTVSITSSESSPTSTSPIPVTVTFSEEVYGFSASDLVVGNGSAVVTGGSDGDSAYTVEITPSSNGIVTVDLAAAKAQDDAGNDNQAATQFSIEFDGTVSDIVYFTEYDPREKVIYNTYNITTDTLGTRVDLTPSGSTGMAWGIRKINGVLYVTGYYNDGSNSYLAIWEDGTRYDIMSYPGTYEGRQFFVDYTSDDKIWVRLSFAYGPDDERAWYLIKYDPVTRTIEEDIDLVADHGFPSYDFMGYIQNLKVDTTTDTVYLLIQDELVDPDGSVQPDDTGWNGDEWDRTAGYWKWDGSTMTKEYLINSKAEYDAINIDISNPSPTFEYSGLSIAVNSSTVHLLTTFEYYDSTAGTPDWGEGIAFFSDSGSGLTKDFSTSLTLGRVEASSWIQIIGSTIYASGWRYDFDTDGGKPTTFYSGYWTWDGSAGVWNETHAPVNNPTETDEMHSVLPYSSHGGSLFGQHYTITVDSSGYLNGPPGDLYLSINGNDGNGWDDDRLLIDGSYYNAYAGGVDFAYATAWYFSWE